MINNIDINEVEVALLKIKPGLEKYMDIIQRLHKVNVKEDREFQKLYNGFYRLRQRKPEFYEMYYEYLEDNKNNEVEFEEVIKYIYEKTGRVEASFASKLVANINPNKPIWDSVVLGNLKIGKPKQYKKSDIRIKESIESYNLLEEKYDEILSSNSAKILIDLFDKSYKDTGISDIKKIDFILWQIR